MDRGSSGALDHEECVPVFSLFYWLITIHLLAFDHIRSCWLADGRWLLLWLLSLRGRFIRVMVEPPFAKANPATQSVPFCSTISTIRHGSFSFGGLMVAWLGLLVETTPLYHNDDVKWRFRYSHLDIFKLCITETPTCNVPCSQAAKESGSSIYLSSRVEALFFCKWVRLPG